MTFPKRILITGSSGFIGRHVVRALRENYPDAYLFGVGRQSGSNAPLDAYLSADINEPNFSLLKEFIENNTPNCLINCMGALTAAPDLAMQTNFMATQVLVNAVSTVSSEIGFVHLGSSAEYSQLPHSVATTESSPTKPVSVYGESKLLATKYVMEASANRLISGLVLRLFNPIGPGMAPATLLGRICDFLSKEKTGHLTLGSLETYRDYVDVRDVASAILTAINKISVLNGEVINIGSGVARQTRELVQGLLEASPCHVTFDEKFSGSSRSDAVIWQEADISKARQMLSWEAKTPWADTLQYIVDGCCQEQ